MRSAALLYPALAALCAAQSGEEFFEKKIRPVLAQKCYACHGPKLKEPIAGLRLDSRAAMLKGGVSGVALIPGNAAQSKLFAGITYTNLDLKMPPTGKLPAEVIEDFRKWIDMGAPAPAEGAVSEAPKPGPIDWNKAREFWAFRAVSRPQVPTVRNASWPLTAPDRFLLARLEEKGLAPAKVADRRVWIRRVTFDLTGLPPSPAEVDAFLADRSPRAYETVVERLLESPHYGERWARHWLDLVRFAETNGHEFDNDKLDAWRYRDYVIRAFNQDIGYDTFVREHIAGDLLAKPRISSDGALRESPLGTSFYWFGEVLNSATDSVKSRADQVDNQIDVIGKTFLGLTLACARCHDHKFDPLPTRDYYALAGILHSTGIREAVIDSPEREAAVRTAAGSGSPADLPRKEVKLRPGDELYADFAGGVPAGWMVSGEAYRNLGKSVQLTGSITSPKFEMPKLWVHVKLRANKAEQGKQEKGLLRVTLIADDHKSAHMMPTGKPGWEWRSARMTKEIGRTCYFEIVDRDRAGFLAVDKIVISDNDKPPAEEDDGATTTLNIADARVPESAWGMIAYDEKPGDVKLHIRGNHKNLGDSVPRGMLQVMPVTAPPIKGGASGRLELAEWLASRENPLTARVMVNRIWRHHFGHGLVRTTDNFGKTGERPSHPELLDWLAGEFMQSGWSVKHVHRLIVLSSAYRMSSRVNPAATQVDPRNDLFSYFPVRRLEAEAIRDSVLAVSGSLDRTLFGPSVLPHISKYQDGRGKPVSGPLDGNGRRSLYLQVRRNFITPMFLAFDYPLPISTIGARGTSTVPSQALLMLNNEFIAEQAKRWAARIEREEPEAARRVTKMYAEAFARAPEEWERLETLAFAAKSGWADLAHALLNSAEFLYVQ